ncbi:hypothetical protein PG995_000179 [Apiospora arundinis]
MKLSAVIMLGLSTLGSAQAPTMFSPGHNPDEPSDVPAASGPVPTSLQVHDHGGAVCPSYYDAFAMLNPIRDGIKYVRHKRHCDVQNRPGYTFCQRMSCSYHSAIFVCNTDQTLPVSPDCNVVAEYAQIVADSCYQASLQGSAPYITQGEVFDALDWHVYVGWSNC